MPDNNTIGSAYIQIKPSTEGISSEIEKALGDAGEAGSSSFGSKFASGVKIAGAAAGAAISAAATGVSAITKSAVSSYAEYEQLVGGVETLFGDSAETVLANASSAFETAGQSMNDYMETSIQSAAALINSLDGDTAKAADLMDVSITDMADNVNKMGTSMEAVQNAYKGFSRGNFTMLDNLALGFAGTKEGMQELLDQASEISGIEYDIDSYSDIVQAIHVVQEEMGIAGTTSREANETISGSLATLGSAWQNLVTGIADPNADLGTLIGNVVNAGVTALDNLMPTIEQALVGIADALVALVPVISERLPGLLEALLPALIEASIGLLNGLIAALPVILSILLEQLPMIISAICDTIITLLPMILDLGLQLILALADGLIQNLPTLIPAVVDVILAIVEKLTQPDTLMQLINAALQLIIALAEGLIKALPQLIAKAPVIIANLVRGIISALPAIIAAGVELIGSLISGIVSCFGQIIEKGAELVSKVKEGLMKKIEDAKTWGKDMIDNFIQGIKDKFHKVKDTLSSLGDLIKGFIGFSCPDFGPLADADEYGPDFMELFASGIRDNIGLVTSAVSDLASGVKADMSLNASVNGAPTAGSLASYQLAPQMAYAGAGDAGDIVIPVYIGNERLDELVIRANQRANYRSGGR